MQHTIWGDFSEAKTPEVFIASMAARAIGTNLCMFLERFRRCFKSSVTIILLKCCFAGQQTFNLAAREAARLAVSDPLKDRRWELNYSRILL